MKRNIKTISQFIRGDRAMSHVRELANFNRVQCSTGYRAAAECALELLQKAGVTAKIISYPYDEKNWYFTSKSFLEWDCRAAQCTLVYPQEKVLADFSADNISIIQRSFACDYRNQPLDIVMLDKGCDEQSYGDIDLRGKLIFVREAMAGFVDWAVAKRGAAGIITDFMREVPGIRKRYDLFDTLNYTSFWWRNTEEEPHTFGFVLTPREGDALCDLCRQTLAAHEKDHSLPKYPQATCFVDASLYAGEIEVVEAVLPGQCDEEILMVAHLCHPKPSANDNCSGVAAGIEAMQVLSELTASGKLPALQRTVRLILVPEFSGTFAYLHGRQADLPKILAGLNLDMVGGRQTRGYGPLSLCAQPHAAPSIVTDVAMLAFDTVRRTFRSHCPNEHIALFNTSTEAFSAGSDHYILSDPTIGIPTPMLGQWPDLNYHTSSDSVDVVDPYILEKSASVAAGYLYTLCNMEKQDASSVLNILLERVSGDIARVLDEGYEKAQSLQAVEQMLAHYQTYHKGCAADLLRFRPDVQAQVQQLQTHIDRQFAAARERYALSAPNTECCKPSAPKYDYVPRRVMPGPIVHLEDFTAFEPSKRAIIAEYIQSTAGKLPSQYLFETFILYYMDGVRTVDQIAQEVVLEARAGDTDMVEKYIRLLLDIGIAEIVK